MNQNLTKIKKEIKTTWKTFWNLTLIFGLIIFFIFYSFEKKEKKYIEEYNSTNWYQVEASYDHSYHHQKREKGKNDDSIDFVDYYDWYLTYIAHDGNTYYHIKKITILKL